MSMADPSQISSRKDCLLRQTFATEESPGSPGPSVTSRNLEVPRHPRMLPLPPARDEPEFAAVNQTVSGSCGLHHGAGANGSLVPYSRDAIVGVRRRRERWLAVTRRESKPARWGRWRER